MNSDVSSKHVLFHELMTTLDSIRRESFYTISSSLQQKMFGLTLRQGTAIAQVRLLMETSPQGIALKTLAQRLQMTVPAASLLVETMVSKGFFERNPNPKDRRAVCIRLSERGMQLYDSVSSRFNEAIDRHTENLTEEELAVLSSIVSKLSFHS